MELILHNYSENYDFLLPVRVTTPEEFSLRNKARKNRIVKNKNKKLRYERKQNV